MALWSYGPGLWEKQERKRRSYGPGESGREGTSFLEARLRGKAKAEKQDLEKQDRSSRFSCSS
ncbi:hypothetical protein BOO29_18010 [Vibrio navarrensis]|nr:hypothetical protein [Vibrio navarrensis]MBE4586800.1 hypothetical protein [Vibrio navarrensis]